MDLKEMLFREIQMGNIKLLLEQMGSEVMSAQDEKTVNTFSEMVHQNYALLPDSGGIEPGHGAT